MNKIREMAMKTPKYLHKPVGKKNPWIGKIYMYARTLKRKEPKVLRVGDVAYSAFKQPDNINWKDLSKCFVYTANKMEQRVVLRSTNIIAHLTTGMRAWQGNGPWYKSLGSSLRYINIQSNFFDAIIHKFLSIVCLFLKIF